MEWIDQLQRDLGGPVLAFAQEHWIVLAAIVGIGVWWLISGGSLGRASDAETGIEIGNPDGGGGDGGD